MILFPSTLPLPLRAGANPAIQKRTGSNPAANAEFSYTLLKPSLLLAVTVACVQGAVQTPYPLLSITDASDVEIWTCPGATAAQAAATTATYHWTRGVDVVGALVGATPNIHAFAPLLEVALPAGYKIKSNTIGKGANTDFGAPTFSVVEFDV